VKKSTYRAPRNAAERIAEARRAISRLQDSMTGDNRVGEYGRNCRDAIARWQEVLRKEGEMC
jgi:hypothetical protein